RCATPRTPAPPSARFPAAPPPSTRSFPSGVVWLLLVPAYLLPRLLAGGALGNIIDRALYSKVTDFIVWKVGSHEWPTFNVADAALVVGIAGLLIDLKPEDKKAKAPAANKKKA